MLDLNDTPVYPGLSVVHELRDYDDVEDETETELRVRMQFDPEYLGKIRG